MSTHNMFLWRNEEKCQHFKVKTGFSMAWDKTCTFYIDVVTNAL